MCAVKHFLVPTSRLRTVDRSLADPKVRDDIRMKLRALAPDANSGHGGETDLIALAVAEKCASGRQQTLLANDAGASIVAHGYGIPTRHSGDVLAEFACADRSLEPQDLLKVFRRAVAVSGITGNAQPKTKQAFTCGHDGRSCGDCGANNAGGQSS